MALVNLPAARHLAVIAMIADKKDISVLRRIAAVWLHENPGHSEADSVRRALSNTNVPSSMGRPRISPEKCRQAVDLMRKGWKYSPIARKLGISPPTVTKIWAEHLVSEAIRKAGKSKKKSS